MKEQQVHLAILNITSWAGYCSDATHLYGKLHLCTNPEITVDTIEEWGTSSFGIEEFEIRQPLTLELAKKLDEKTGDSTYQRHFEWMEEDPEFIKKYPEMASTEKFDTFDEVVEAGIKKWKELGLKCTFISVYEGEKYYKNDYNQDETVILQPE